MALPRLWPVLLAGAALAAAPASAYAAKPAVHTVTLAQMSFGKVPGSIRVGDSIEWVNDDIFVHSATAQDKSFDVELKPKAHARTVFRKAGRFAFTCRDHPGMKGVVVVRP